MPDKQNIKIVKKELDEPQYRTFHIDNEIINCVTTAYIVRLTTDSVIKDRRVYRNTETDDTFYINREEVIGIKLPEVQKKEVKEKEEQTAPKRKLRIN